MPWNIISIVVRDGLTLWQQKCLALPLFTHIIVKFVEQQKLYRHRNLCVCVCANFYFRIGNNLISHIHFHSDNVRILVHICGSTGMMLHKKQNHVNANI